VFFFFQAEDGIRDPLVTGVQTCALPIWLLPSSVITEPKYLKLLTCSILCPSTVMLTISLPSQRTTIVFVFWTLNFMPKFSAVSRSEERRVGKECRYMLLSYFDQKNTNQQ